jgi:circadian clock protein KaiC
MIEQQTPLEAASSAPEKSYSNLIQTGIPGLDRVLNGGLPIGALLLVVGSPGTGKTVLAHQTCFNLVSNGNGRALYFSTLSEPHDKMLRQLQSFAFYDANCLGDTLILLALQEFLKQGLEAIAEVVVRTARQQQARLVCIDGYRAIEALCQNEVESRQFLYQLSAQLHLLGATLLVTLEREGGDRDDYGAYTVADGVLICYHELLGMQRRRKVEVKKLRSMAHVQGLHSYRINADGWTVFPRIETLVSAETSAAPRSEVVERRLFGIRELDRMLGGGIPAGSTTLIVGGPGVGKTLLGLHYLIEGLRQGEPSLFVGFNERREQLLEKAQRFGMPLAEAVQSGQIRIRTFTPVEVEPDEISSAIRHEIDTYGIRRMVIDATFELERATAREGRSHDYMGALVTYLRDVGVTVCMTKLINKVGADGIDFSDTPLSVVAENLLLLQHFSNEATQRYMLAILKMRDSNYDQDSYEYSIDDDGLKIHAR